MDTIKLKECIMRLDELKKDAQEVQKKGLPFMMASVVIWTMILAVQFLNMKMISINFYTFMCSSFLLPLAFGFSKVIKADIFKKTDNPINKLGFICTLNQMLYLVIVMWAFSKSPEAMLLLYAMVFGAHLLPYGWVYDSKAYTAAAIIETIGAMLIFTFVGRYATVLFMIVVQIVVCICLATEIRKAKTKIESRY
ncbi:hypothetical protein SAMN02910369_01052 [Lachnospiraceae bacterium NE2001]|nr:hypothetical protein SAMN02910369_01052 [Lachnospiraceae bacterium NE2001]